MVATLISTPRFFYRDPADDTPLAGGKVYTYAAGTTTPKTTWADYDQNSTLPNPVILDADGGADIFGNGSYRIIVRRADETLVYEVDDVIIGNGEGSGNTLNRGEVIYTTDHQITAADDGLTLIANRPTAITFSIDPASSLGPNFAVIIKNIGLGTLTLDPALTEMIDGVGTRTIESGGSALLFGDGTAFRTFFYANDLINKAIAVANDDNIGITVAINTPSAGQMTVSLKGADGNDPSPTNIVNLKFRSVTPGSGLPEKVAITAPVSLVISSGSTLGAPTSSVPFRLWLVAFNDGGTVKLGLMLATTFSAARQVVRFPLAAWGIGSATAEGGVGGSDSAQTFYASSAVTAKAYKVLGYLSFDTGLATAGTWSTAPARVQMYDESVKLPGDVIQQPETAFPTGTTGTTILPADNSIPQITEGDQYMTQAITPTSPTSLLQYEGFGFWANSANANLSMGLFRDAITDALSAVKVSPAGPNNTILLRDEVTVLAGSVASTTFRTRVGGDIAGTTTFNGLFSDRAGSLNRVTEIAS